MRVDKIKDYYKDEKKFFDVNFLKGFYINNNKYINLISKDQTIKLLNKENNKLNNLLQFIKIFRKK